MADFSLELFDVVVVPFPFTDRDAAKRRPALVLSSRSFNQASQHSVMAMFTSAEQSAWLGDHVIADLEIAGLPTECVVRLKIFTLDHRLVVRKAGTLAAPDQKNCVPRGKACYRSEAITSGHHPIFTPSSGRLSISVRFFPVLTHTNFGQQRHL